MRINFVATVLSAGLALSACEGDDKNGGSDPVPTEHPSAQIEVKPPVVIAPPLPSPVISESPAPAPAPVQPLPVLSTEGQPSAEAGTPAPVDAAGGVASAEPAPAVQPSQPLAGGEAPAPAVADPALNPPSIPPPLASETAVNSPSPGREAPPTEPTNQPQSPPASSVVAVLGDSISTGVLADTRLGQGIGARIQDMIGRLFAGDLTSRVEAQRALARPEIAAVSTSEVYGLKSTIARKNGLNLDQVELVNLAQFGALSTEMPFMVEQLKTAEGYLARKTDTIFIMLGSNDFCSESSVEDFRVNYESGLAHLLRQHPKAHYIMAPIPSIDQLSAIDHTYIPAFPGTSGAVLSCNTLHRSTCARLDEPGANERLHDMNVVILDAAEKMKALVGNEQVTTVPRIIDWKITREQLSFDCFHPSSAGQRALGELVGEAILKP